MSPEVQFEIDRMKACIEATAELIGPTKSLEGNCEALKSMMFGLMNGLAGLTHIVGADSKYIPDADYLSDDIDDAFSDAIDAEDAAQPDFSAPYSTLNHRALGLLA